MAVYSEPRISPEGTSLDVPDHITWESHPNYDVIVADRLVRAYQLMNGQPTHEGILTATRLALSCLDLPLCECQRVRAVYVVAQGYAARDELDEAMWWIDQARDQAQRVPDYQSIIDLLYMRGQCNMHRLELIDASRDLEGAAAHLRALLDPRDQAIAAQLIATLNLHASVCYFLLDSPGMQHLVREAHDLVPTASNPPLKRASVGLVEAQLLRHLDHADQAIPIALRAAATFDRENKPHNEIRARVLVAAAHLDVAARHPPGAHREEHCTFAGSHLRAAQHVAMACGDDHGGASIILEYVRLNRLRRTRRDRVKPIERAVSTAREVHDKVLLAQALTVLGDEYRALSQMDAARQAYREVLRVLGGHEVPALANPVWNALESLGA